MIDKSKTYRTRDGREVRIYATDGDGPFPVHGAIKNVWWDTETWTKEGAVDAYLGRSGDLIEVRPRHKRTVWVNVHPHTAKLYGSKEFADIEAQSFSCKDRIACLRVELDFEEGEGL